MAKFKISDLSSNMPGVLNKFKTMLDSLAGPGSAEATHEALEKEQDPMKVKFLELELLINQLHDIQVIQNRTVNTLRTKHSELIKMFEALKQAESEQEAASKQQTETGGTTAIQGEQAKVSEADAGDSPKTTTKKANKKAQKNNPEE